MTAPPELEIDTPDRPEPVQPMERRGWLSGWLTTREAADELGLSSSRIRQFYLQATDGCEYSKCVHGKQRRLPGTKRGRDLLFRARDLSRLSERRNGRPPGEAWRGRPGIRQRSHASAAA